jgi:hypothetical protein
MKFLHSLPVTMVLTATNNNAITNNDDNDGKKLLALDSDFFNLSVPSVKT